jgi:hypothetical protein
MGTSTRASVLEMLRRRKGRKKILDPISLEAMVLVSVRGDEVEVIAERVRLGKVSWIDTRQRKGETKKVVETRWAIGAPVLGFDKALEDRRGKQLDRG